MVTCWHKIFPEARSDAVCALTFPHNKSGLNKNLCQELIELEFEGHMFLALKDWDQW